VWDNDLIYYGSLIISLLMILVHHWIDHEVCHSMAALRLHYRSKEAT
jgi:hypothetical protein